MHAERLDTTLAPPKGGAPRSPGVHASNLIRGLAIETGKLKLDLGEAGMRSLSITEVADNTAWWNGLPSGAQLKISMGLAWERWYLEQLDETVVGHPGEMELDGVFLTHDGVSLDMVASEHPGGYKQVLALHEIKLTYKSINTVGDLTNQFLWLMQVKAYCRALGTRIAYLHILYVCGDYSHPLSPVLHVWRIEFDQGEIDEAWMVLLN